MLKKTTIYLEDKELEKLKALSFALNTSMTDLIRKGIQSLYQSLPKEQLGVLKALGEIQKTTSKTSSPERKLKKSAPQKSGSNKRSL